MVVRSKNLEYGYVSQENVFDYGYVSPENFFDYAYVSPSTTYIVEWNFQAVSVV